MSPLGLFPDFFDTPGERKRTGMTRLGSPGVLSRSVFGFVCQKNPEMDGEPLSLQARVTIGNICVGLSPSSFQCPSPVMKDKKRRPDRSVYVYMCARMYAYRQIEQGSTPWCPLYTSM